MEPGEPDASGRRPIERKGSNFVMRVDKFLKDGEWWDPNAPKPEAAPAAK